MVRGQTKAQRRPHGKLILNPQIPAGWQRYTFRLLIKDQPVEVSVTRDVVEVLYQGPSPVTVAIWGKDHTLIPSMPLRLRNDEARLARA